ncbi:MAG: hypothetical protein RIQ62_1830 [Bacteroidota bacterium]
MSTSLRNSLALSIQSKIRNLSLGLIFLFPSMLSAQITVTPNITAANLINRLIGNGIVYTNPLLTCPTNASGKFDNGMASSVLIDSGIVLTTGRALTSGTNYGVNGIGSNFASVNNNTNGGDANLATAAGTAANNLHDLCKLEFDFTPTGDTVQFKYRFGSEEYPLYNCTDYNDIFAFFISGPGYATPTNVALVPGTSIPVSINSINNGSISATAGGNLTNCTSLGTGSPFTSYYVNTSASTSITYNGLTSLLTAKAAVTPCSTYHMKFAIADLSDHLYDSGVFLEAGSFTSDIASIASVSSSNGLSSPTPFAIEGCAPAVITITRPNAQAFPQTVTYTLSGTASNGLDIGTLSGSAVIPAYAASTTISINALADGLIEGTETLILSINGSLCGGSVTETLTVLIQDYPSYNKPANDTLCAGQSTTLTALVSPVNPNLTFSWSPSASLSSSTGNPVIATPLTSTTYTLTASYPGCPNRDSSITLTVDPTPTLSLSSTNVLCNNASNGSITATATVGISPLSLTINPGSTIGNTSPFTFIGLNPNTYTVTLSSGSGCTTTATKTITQPNALVWSTPSSTNPSCNGTANGSISASVSGGTGTINYSLSPGTFSNTSGVFGSLTANTYTLTATDANGCSTSTQITLSNASAITWSINTSNNVSPCFGNSNGSIQVNANGGTGTFTYTLQPTGANNNTGSFSPLNIGIYTVVATDGNGCTLSTTKTIVQPAALQLNALNITPVSCFGGSNGQINIQVTGGTGPKQYVLQPGSVTSSTGLFTGLNAGVYTLISTDANGCSLSNTATITQPTIILINTPSTSPVSCNGGNNGSLSVIGSGGSGSFTYSLMPGGISNSSGSFSGLSAALYTITISDANACTKTTTASILQPNPLTLSTPVSTPVSCWGMANGLLSTQALGGNGSYQYIITPGANMNGTGSFSGLSANTYTISVSDLLGCSATTSGVITQPTVLQFSTCLLTNPSCNTIQNGSIQYSAIGGSAPYQYALNAGAYTGSGSFSSLSNGTYTLHIKDNQGCVKDSIVQLTPIYNVTITNNSVQNVLCKNGNTGFISLSGNGGVSPYTYTINGSAVGTSGVFPGLTAGNYTIQAIDNAGCIKDTLIQISEPAAAIGFNTVTVIPVFCYGASAGIIHAFGIGGTPAYQYALNAGAYQANGNFQNLSAGTYTLSIQDANNCIHDSVIQITQPAAPLFLYLKNLKDVSCTGIADGQIKVGSTGGVKPYTYSINGIPNGTDSVFSNLSNGNYLIEVTDSNGCKTSKTFVLLPPANDPVIQIDGITENHCKADMTGSIDWSAMNGTPPFTYFVNTLYVDTNSFINNLSTGNYHIQLTDQKGCKTDTVITLLSSSNLDIQVSVTPATCSGDGNDGKAIANISGGFAPYQYTWVGFVNSSDTLYHIPFGSYITIVQDAENCLDTASYTIDYIPCCEVSIPNAFSPNNDGQNDFFRVIHHGQIQIKSFDIFDRWGNKLFHTNQLGDGWNGRFAGTLCEIGTYYYLLTYYCPLSQDLQLKKGDFTLLR